MLLHDWNYLMPNVVFAGRELGEVDSLNYLVGCSSPDGRTSDKMISRIHEVKLVFIELRHL